MIKPRMDQWTKLGATLLAPNSIATIGIGLFHVSLLTCILFWHWNRDFTKDFLLPYLSMLGSLAAAFATFVAAVVALGIARWQDEVQRKRHAIGCLHHAMAVVNDLRGRLHSVGEQLQSGGWPVIALTLNAEIIGKRMESLFDREIYMHLSGRTVDRITAVQGSLFGLHALVATIDTAFEVKKHAPLPKPSEESQIPTLMEKIDRDLDAIFSDLREARLALDTP